MTTAPSTGNEAARAAIVEPLQRVLGWLLAQADPGTGALICPQHGIEHTGKSAGAVVLATELARFAPEADRDGLFEVARAQCARIAGRLEREGDSACFTFRPGRHDPYNCSNSVIDGGACSEGGTFSDGGAFSGDGSARLRFSVG